VRRFFKPISLVLAFTLSACASFKSGELPWVEEEDILVKSTYKTKIALDFSQVKFDKSGSEKALLQIVNLSGCCDVVPEKDAEVIVRGWENVSPYMGGGVEVITGATFGLIPTWMTMPQGIKVMVTRQSLTKTYDLKDSTVVVNWLPMAIFFPFAMIGVQEKAVSRNIYRTIIFKMKQDGFFDSTPASDIKQ
jgi:hypothetical protein